MFLPERGKAPASCPGFFAPRSSGRSRQFDEPIPPPDGRLLLKLMDPGDYARRPFSFPVLLNCLPTPAALRWRMAISTKSEKTLESATLMSVRHFWRELLFRSIAKP